MINLEKNDINNHDSRIMRYSLLACSLLLFIGLLFFTMSRRTTVSKAQPQDSIKSGDNRPEITQPKPESEPPLIVTRKPQQPIIVEEGSQAYFCLKANGGSSCLSRDRKAPEFKIVEPPEPPKTYEDYLVQYGIRSSSRCGQYFNGQPNCN